ncbi:hypothetical protein LTR05_008660 [Lithohypha guttulata]|uniref:non-specific serine/threonine protein kinase n=1 Tax=Lithohypha guttulata TaxID=1690604 RepID=A0AAN7PJN8_9EURO|nr:hypothetical protein LTR05_008660 [Lithohypha guttulata]
MALRKDDEKFIDKNPLKIDQDVLSALTETTAAIRHASPEHDGLLTRRDAISNLLAALLANPVAKRLTYSLRPVNGQLATIYASLQSEAFDLSPFTSLAKIVASKTNDTEVWQAVLQLIADLSRLTPPRSSIPPSFSGTPLRRSSASFRNSKQKREDLRKHIQTELAGRTYEDVPEFINKYFEDKPWSEKVSKIYNKLPADDPLRGFPETSKPDEVDFWSWLNDFQQQYLQDAPNVFCRAANKSEIVGATGERQLDILLKTRVSTDRSIHDLEDCLIVGELTTSDASVWKSKFTQLATYMRDVFNAQPIRRFVHGFLIFGVQMQLWVFDRSGAYSAVKFDIRQQPQQFIRVLAGYAWMTSEELGLDIFVQRDGPCLSVILSDLATDAKRTFQIQDKPFFQQPAIACRGTTCYRSMDGKHVIKFSWRPDKAQSEVEHLTRAQGIKGVPKLVGSSTITTIDELRSGLRIKKLRDLGHIVYEKSVDSAQLSFTSQSTQQLESLSVSGVKRKAVHRDESPPKRSRSNSQRSHLSQEVHPADGVDHAASTMPPPHSPRCNRVLTCLAIEPAGRPLQDFSSVCEVLQAFRDTIKAHRELFTKRHILHRDVSHGNIILTDPEQADGCSGMLIDYDLAVQVSSDGRNETSLEKNMTGTLEFMAIEVLEAAVRKETSGIERTYRHDLESFFYVLLALCIRYGWEKGIKPKLDVLRPWYDATYGQIARTKRGDMDIDGFEVSLLSSFSPAFDCIKPLARTLRDVLFGKGALYTKTPVDPEHVYGSMIAAFDEAIKVLVW